MNVSNSIDIGAVVREWFQTAREKRELLAMEDRMLRDIGLTRADAQHLVEKPMPRLPAALHAGAERIGPSDVDPAMIRACIDRAHVLRARAFGESFRALLRWFRGHPNARTRKLAPVAR